MNMNIILFLFACFVSHEVISKSKKMLSGNSGLFCCLGLFYSLETFTCGMVFPVTRLTRSANKVVMMIKAFLIRLFHVYIYLYILFFRGQFGFPLMKDTKEEENKNNESIWRNDRVSTQGHGSILTPG